MISKSDIVTYIKKNKTYIYPAVILLIFFIFVVFKISGTSIGTYHDLFYGSSKKDANLIYGKPRPIRSDEWLVATQLTIAQEANEFKRFNYNLLGGQDTTLLINVPSRDWPTIFKPENISFFALPFEHAFAFKWWFMLILLLLGSYAFALKILGKRILLSVFFSLIVSFAPFVFWWYQSGTILPLAYGFLILCVGMSIIDKTKLNLLGKKINTVPSVGLKIIAMVYLLGCYAFVFYPPFQIPIAICVTFFLIGYLLNQKLTKKDVLHIGVPVFVTILLTGILIGLFVLTRMDAFKAISETAYPGRRVVASGNYDGKKLLVTYLQPFLQSNSRGSNYIANQSESSSFILNPLYLIIPFISLFSWVYIKFRKFDWVLFLLILCNLLFLAFLFIPGVDWLIKPFFLHIVPHERLLIAIGFLTIITFAYAIRLYADKKIKLTRKIKIAIGIYSAVLFVVMAWAGLETAKLYPLFVTNKKIAFVLLAILFTGIVLTFYKKFRIGLGIIALFSIGSVVYVHPLYVGMGPIYNSALGKAIQEVSPENSVWAVADSIIVEHLPQMNGRTAVTGVSAYPNIPFWKTYVEPVDDAIYNRYAHVVASSSDDYSANLVGFDTFSFSAACERKISQRIEYILSSTIRVSRCEKLLKTVHYPQVTYYLYKQ